MTHICSCIFPIWMYKQVDGREEEEEFFALPVEVAEERGIEIRDDLGDILLDIRRDGRDIKFVAIPFETVQDRGIESEIPEIQMVEHEISTKDGSSIVKQFMKVTWQKVTDEFAVKKYDVRGHIFIAGCRPSEMVKEMGIDDLTGKEKEILRCSEKGIFSVLHPIDEFLESHIEELHSCDLSHGV